MTDNVPYSTLSTQNAPQHSDFVSVQPQPVQPTYVMTTQVIVQDKEPVVDRHNAIMSRLHGKNCCGCITYPTGVKIVTIIQIVEWFVWSIAYIKINAWWLWPLVVLAILMCYYGFTGAIRLDEKRLNLYFHYLVCMAILNLVMLFVFAATGYEASIAGWVIGFLLLLYWCYIVRDFKRIIHDVDYGTNMLGGHHHDHDHHHHDHDDDNH